MVSIYSRKDSNEYTADVGYQAFCLLFMRACPKALVPFGLFAAQKMDKKKCAE